MSRQSYERRGIEYGLLTWRVAWRELDTADDAVVVATTNLLATIIHSDNDDAGRGH